MNDIDIENELAKVYGCDEYISEDEIINEINSIICFIDFSKIRIFDCKKATCTNWLDLAFFRKHYNVLEFMLNKYYEFNPDSLKEIKNGTQVSFIQALLNNSVYNGDYDLVELCLKYVDNINELDFRGLTYVQFAKVNPYCDEHLVQLLEMHSMS